MKYTAPQCNLISLSPLDAVMDSDTTPIRPVNDGNALGDGTAIDDTL